MSVAGLKASRCQQSLAHPLGGFGFINTSLCGVRHGPTKGVTLRRLCLRPFGSKRHQLSNCSVPTCWPWMAAPSAPLPSLSRVLQVPSSGRVWGPQKADKNQLISVFEKGGKKTRQFSNEPPFFTLCCFSRCRGLRDFGRKKSGARQNRLMR